MPVAASDLIRYGCANHVIDDTSAVGGAIDTDARPLDSQFSAAAAPYIESDNAGDTMNVTIIGRIADGSIASETKALNGTTPVAFSTSFQRIHSIALASAASGTVLVKQGSGGTTRHTFAAGETDAFTFFQRASSSGSTETRYEKAFWKNTHAALALTDAQVTLTADPNSNYRVGLDAAQNGSTSAANRKTAPSGVTFVDDSVAINVPGTDLGAGDAIGYWLEQTLSASEAAAQDTATTQLSGDTT